MFNWIKNFFKPKSGIRVASNIRASGNVSIGNIKMTGNGGNMSVSGGKVSLSGRSCTIDGVTICVGDDLEKAVKKLTDLGYTNVKIEQKRNSLKVEYNA